MAHWTLGRLALALAIANIFIGFTLSSVAYSHIIAQAVVLGGLFIIVVLKNDIEYLLVRISPAEEERLLKDTYSSSGNAFEACTLVSIVCFAASSCPGQFATCCCLCGVQCQLGLRCASDINLGVGIHI